MNFRPFVFRLRAATVAAASVATIFSALSAVAAGGAPVPKEALPAAAAMRRQTRGVSAAYARTPLAFVENRGQTDSCVRFLVNGPDYNAFVTPTEMVFAFAARPAGAAGSRRLAGSATSAVLRMRLVGANSAPQITG